MYYKIRLTIAFIMLVLVYSCSEEVSKQNYKTNSSCRNKTTLYDVPFKSFDQLSSSDIVKIMKWAMNSKAWNKKWSEIQSYNFFRGFYPKVIGIGDTALINRLYGDEYKKAEYNALDWYDLMNIARSEFVIVGQVVSKDEKLCDKECQYFKSEYGVKIIKAYKVPLGYDVGDTIYSFSAGGYLGKCYTGELKSHEEAYEQNSHGANFEIGDVNLMMMSHYEYYVKLMSLNKDKYKDEYNSCKVSFILDSHHYNLMNKFKLKNIKQFINQNH